MQQREGQLVDVHLRKIYPARVTWSDGVITAIAPIAQSDGPYILPGFVDAHVHIESSMVVPSEFARLAVRHGTVGTVSDPHEIANVLGVAGVSFMIENGKKVPFHFAFGAPSCVPATKFETSGAEINAAGVTQLLAMPEVRYLAEMMNYPGVLQRDPEVMAKLVAAQAAGKPIDGHAPGLTGKDAEQYAAAGISTDHECFTLDEALYKAKLGMKILIREGSAARNFDALIPILNQFPDQVMFCSDDKHPDSLLEGHINLLVAKAVQQGYDLFEVLRAASVHPVEHYRLPIGLLRPGDGADFIMVDDLEHFNTLETWINGQCVAQNGESKIGRVPIETPNQFRCELQSPEAFRVQNRGTILRAIKALDGELITKQVLEPPLIRDGFAVCDTQRDLLKIAVINRYAKGDPQVAFIQGFGIQNGAIASCVAHDSHNIIAVGTDDALIAKAVNLIVDHRGGVSAVTHDEQKVLPLPVAGIMSDGDGFQVADAYQSIDEFARQTLGSPLRAPFMTLSFMALLVIPDLKLSDKGLFSGKQFEFVSLFNE
jgi:adenine deaminase